MRFIGSLIALAVASMFVSTVASAERGGFHGHSGRMGNAKVGGSGRALTVVRVQHSGFHGRFVSMGSRKVAGSVGVPSPAHPLRPPLHGRGFGRGFRPFAPIGLGYPVALYPPLDYYDAPAYYPPSAAGIPVPNDIGSQPEPDAIQYPGGRYELRGDGITSPYVWVWIPDPPPGPPASGPYPGAATSRPSLKTTLPEPKIITIQPTDASSSAQNDPTEPKIISVPRANTGSSAKR
jgi:hypothetical protein